MNEAGAYKNFFLERMWYEKRLEYLFHLLPKQFLLIYLFLLKFFFKNESSRCKSHDKSLIRD